jgi:hypothetical protein
LDAGFQDDKEGNEISAFTKWLLCATISLETMQNWMRDGDRRYDMALLEANFAASEAFYERSCDEIP